MTDKQPPSKSTSGIDACPPPKQMNMDEWFTPIAHSVSMQEEVHLAGEANNGADHSPDTFMRIMEKHLNHRKGFGDQGMLFTPSKRDPLPSIKDFFKAKTENSASASCSYSSKALENHAHSAAPHSANILHRSLIYKEDKQVEPKQLEVKAGVKLQGKLSQSIKSLLIHGEVRLDGATLHDAVVKQDGTLYGSAQIEQLRVEGKVEGELTVTGTLEILPGASVKGKIRYHELTLHPGGELSGDIGSL